MNKRHTPYPSLLTPHCLFAPLRNERGSGLFVAMLMLALLTILGLAAIGTSVTELRIAGNQRAHKQAFLVADAGVNYALKMGSSFIDGTFQVQADNTFTVTTDQPVALDGQPWSSSSLPAYMQLKNVTTDGALRTYRVLITGLSGSPASAVARVEVEIETAPSVGRLEEPGATPTEY